MLWVAFAVLCLVVIALLVFPLLKGSADGPSRADYDMVVYRSQLGEIEQEIESGLLTAEQADAARAEIYRRMLSAEDAELKSPLRFLHGGSKIVRIGAAVAIIVIVPCAAGLFYAAIGSPGLPGKPYIWRVHNDPAFVMAASADQLSRLLAANPTAAGYKQLGRMYFASRQFAQAADADRRAIELGATDAGTWADFGEALVVSGNGVVVPEAMEAFVNAITRDPHSESARFYIGLAEAQIGNVHQAVSIWRDLERGGAPDAPWLPMLRENIANFSRQAGIDPTSIAPAPPDVKAIGAALTAMTSAMHNRAGVNPSLAATPPTNAAPGDDRDTMIRAMVQRLADRMARTPNDIAGWQRLAHVYTVMGQFDKARQAADHAVHLRPNDVGTQLSLAEVQKAAAPVGDDTPADFITTMRTVLKLDPTNVQALYYVGLAELKAGHAEQARQMWTAAIRHSEPNDALTTEIRSRLAAIPGG